MRCDLTSTTRQRVAPLLAAPGSAGMQCGSPLPPEFRQEPDPETPHVAVFAERQAIVGVGTATA